MSRPFVHGSLFSGIGGFDLASEWMGWTNIFHCEWNQFGQKILKHYWPNAISYDDICKTDFTIHRGEIDILTGGFPCQPYSVAGLRKGTEDSRHLWPEMLRAIRECRPTWIVGENVPGLINWNEGLVFEQVCAELESEGYEVQPIVLPACGVNAPHRRDRVWIVAHSNGYRDSDRSGRIQKESESERMGYEYAVHEFEQSNKVWEFSSDTNCQGFEKRIPGRIGSIHYQDGTPKRRESSRRNTKVDWSEFPTVAPLCNGDDGLSYGLDGITFSKWRNESIKAGGNAIVPQVAFQIFKAIEQCT